MRSSESPLILARIGGLALVVLLTVGAVGCDRVGGGGGESGETISAGAGQAVIPKQELQNLGETEKSLAPPAKKAR